MENLSIGITIMVIGMLVVFVFLGLMIVVMNITAKTVDFINKYFPEEVPQEQTTRNKKQTDDAEIALAIAIASKEGARV